MQFRPATLHDSERLLEWRNDPLTRQNSVHTEPIERSEHKSWLHQTLSNSARKLYIAEENGHPVGTVRFDRTDDNAWELSWTVAPQFRGRGIGKRLVAAAVDLMSAPLTAQISASNLSSLQIARATGFLEYGKKGTLTLWRRTPRT